MHFDLAGRLALSVLDDDERVSRYLTKQLAPFAAVDGPLDARTGDVVLAPSRGDVPPIVEEQRPANDDLTTATDGQSVFVLVGGRRCSIPDALSDGPATFEYEPGFPLWRVFRSAIRPAMPV